MHLELFDYALWFGTPLVQAVILFAMRKRKLHSLYPWFFGYTLLQIVSVLILAFIFSRSYTLYYYSYYVELCLSVFLSFAVIYEVTRASFDPDEISLRLLEVFCVAVVLAGFAVLSTTTAISPSNIGPLSGTFFLADRVVRIFQVVLLIGLTLFSRWLRISSRSFSYGVMLGFGLFAFINMLVATVATHHDFPNSRFLSRVNGLAYLAATMIWVAYSIYGSPDPSGFDYAKFQLDLDREFREWMQRNLRDFRITWIRDRRLT